MSVVGTNGNLLVINHFTSDSQSNAQIMNANERDEGVIAINNRSALMNFSKSTIVSKQSLSISKQNLNPNVLRTRTEKVIEVKPKAPTKKFYSRSFAFTFCPSVTTIWVDSLRCSYLTEPTSDENFYYLTMFDGGGKESILNSMLEHIPLRKKVPQSHIYDFTDDLFKFTKKIFGKKTLVSHNKRYMAMAVVFTILFIVSLFTQSITYFIGKGDFIYNVALTSVTFAFFLLSCSCWGCYSVNVEKLVYNRVKFIMAKNEEFAKFIIRWNNIMREYDVYITAPQTLQYLQFTLSLKVKLSIEPHEHKSKDKVSHNKKEVVDTGFCKNYHCFGQSTKIPCYKIDCGIAGKVCITKNCENTTLFPHHYHHTHYEEERQSVEYINTLT